MVTQVEQVPELYDVETRALLGALNGVACLTRKLPRFRTALRLLVSITGSFRFLRTLWRKLKPVPPPPVTPRGSPFCYSALVQLGALVLMEAKFLAPN